MLFIDAHTYSRLAFPDTCKAALDLLELKIGKTYLGLGAAANALARATRMARDLHVACALERHFTTLGTARWLASLVKALEAIDEPAGGHEWDLSSNDTDDVRLTKGQKRQLAVDGNAPPCFDMAEPMQALALQVQSLADRMATVELG